MYFKCLDNGIFGSNSYIIWNENSQDALLIDAGVDAQSIMSVLDSNDLILKKIVLTHYHFDHVYYLNEIKNLTNAQILIHHLDKIGLSDADLNGSSHFSKPETFYKPDKTLEDNEIFTCANLEFRVIHTPGHTKGCICLLVESSVFTGDTIFKGSMGRTDLPGAQPEKIIPSIKNKLYTLPLTTRVYPGHGGSSTIDFEIKHNKVVN